MEGEDRGWRDGWKRNREKLEVRSVSYRNQNETRKSEVLPWKNAPPRSPRLNGLGLELQERVKPVIAPASGNACRTANKFDMPICNVAGDDEKHANVSTQKCSERDDWELRRRDAADTRQGRTETKI